MIATILAAQEYNRKKEQERLMDFKEQQKQEGSTLTNIQIKKWLLPVGHPGRSGRKMTHIQGITIHDTGNLDPRSTARANCKYVHKHCKQTNTKVSFHWCIDDKEAVLLMPLDEVTFHGSCGEANNTTISIEICVARGMNWKTTHDNAVAITVWLLKNVLKVPNGRKVDKYLFTHSDWIKKYKVNTTKICPRQMLQNGIPYPWETFVKKVNSHFV